MSITCDLYGQWIDMIRNILEEKWGYDTSALSDQDIDMTWESWQQRRISKMPRTVARADNFTCPPELQSGLKALEEAFESGDDVTPWQSNSVDNINFRDKMLTDFGVNHFHLGPMITGCRFSDRTDELLFAVVNHNKVYEIGIYNHDRDNWIELDILNIIDCNWPEVLDPYTIKGAFDVSPQEESIQDVKNLRDNDINSVRKLRSGRIIVPPGGGVLGDGRSAFAMNTTRTRKKQFEKWEEYIIHKIKSLIEKGDISHRDYIVRLECNNMQLQAVCSGYIWLLKRWHK